MTRLCPNCGERCHDDHTIDNASDLTVAEVVFLCQKCHTFFAFELSDEVEIL
jgi:hypothetical protein